MISKSENIRNDLVILCSVEHVRAKRRLAEFCNQQHSLSMKGVRVCGARASDVWRRRVVTGVRMVSDLLLVRVCIPCSRCTQASRTDYSRVCTLHSGIASFPIH